MDKKFLVIGSNSFSGSHFVDDLINLGIKVLGVSRSEEPSEEFLPYKWNNNNLDNFNFEKIDLNKDLDKLINHISKFKPTHIVNFASQGMVAESWKKPIDWYKTNEDWEGRAMIAGRMSKARRNVILTSNYIKKALNLNLSDDEQALEDEFCG